MEMHARLTATNLVAVAPFYVYPNVTDRMFIYTLARKSQNACWIYCKNDCLIEYQNICQKNTRYNVK